MNGCHIKPEQFFNLIFGYYDRYSEALAATSTGEASTFARSTAVPTGEVWVIEAVSAFHDDPTARLTAINMYDATNRVVLARTLSLAQYVQILWSGRITLKAGDKVEVQCDSLTTGKGIAGVAWGYKMKVA